MNIVEYLERKRIEVDRFLDLVAPPSVTPPTTLHESMRYSLLAGGSESDRSWRLPRRKRSGRRLLASCRWHVRWNSFTLIR